MTTEEIKKIDWDVQRFNAYPFFLSSVATLSGFQLPWGLSYKHFLCISRNKGVEWHYDKGDYQALGEAFWKRIKVPSDLEKIIKIYRDEFNVALEKAKYNGAKLNTFSAAELEVLLKRQVDLLWKSAGIAHIIEGATFVGEQKLERQHRIDFHKLNPSGISFLRRAELFAGELCRSGKTDRDILKEFRKEFGWVHSSYLGRNEISLESIRELANHSYGEPIEPDEIRDERTKNFVQILLRLFEWQDERKGNILKSIYLSEPVLDALASKLGISKTTVKYLLPEEIARLKEKDFLAVLETRTELFVDYAPRDLHRTIFVGHDAEKFVKEFNKPVEQAEGSINGQIAFMGKVTGQVRICLSLESIDNFQTGEVLVASMTRPEYAPAMKKAIAFITDEGGITCHAAIIAREMKKPCIIGTKIATKILKDGDVVEVNANHGWVKIAKR